MPACACAACPYGGSDRLVSGEGATRWKLFGIIPVMTVSGADITRSTMGRLHAESVWLPSVLCGNDVSWTTSGSSHLHAGFTAHDETSNLAMTINNKGRLESLKLPRWGNPEGAEFHYVDFGGVAEEEGTFSGYTIPTRLRIGWYRDTDRFASEGKFFRVTIDDAVYR